MTTVMKFRAWDKFNACFYFSENYGLADFFVRMKELEENGIVYQQATGLQDFNKEDIYEGDIVSFTATAHYKEHGKVTDVIFSEDLQFVARGSVPGVDDRNKVEHGLPLVWGGWECMEVIGNNFQNPELLDGEPTEQQLDLYYRQAKINPY